jgi:hypothetical protein
MTFAQLSEFIGPCVYVPALGNAVLRSEHVSWRRIHQEVLISAEEFGHDDSG